MNDAIARAAAGEPPSDEEALAWAEPTAALREELSAAARAVRDRRWGRTVTFSPKVFLPLTNLCRNRCDYCSFRRSPGDPGEHTMSPDEVRDYLVRARALGCAEALFCLGDKPDGAFSAYRRTLASFGQPDTVSYLAWAGELALELGLLPHTNAGILSADDMTRLKRVNVSLGLMLENVSARLCEPGMPHHKAPDKRPEKRLAMLDDAGRLAIPFTTGLLVGIGETPRERIETLLAIRRSHRAHGHVQEVIVQNFRAHEGTPMATSPEPSDREVAHAVAVARLVLDADVGVQAPPNLNPSSLAMLLDAGINDFGGISPLTPDFINPGHPWPHLDALAATCERLGYALAPRLAVYDAYLERPEWVLPSLSARAREVRERLRRWPAGAPSEIRSEA